MAIKPFPQTIRILFEQNSTFEVPKYQRGYAWEDEAIEDFIDDISRCLDRRLAGQKKNHFFGGIVAIDKDIPKSARSNYEVIDGQQRLASCVLLAAVIIDKMQKIVKDLDTKEKLTTGEKTARTYFQETIEPLRQTYLSYRDNIELEYVEVPKLTLSQADNKYFNATLEGTNEEPSRTSHERIQAAWKKLQQFISDVADGHSVSGKAMRLQKLVNDVLAQDCYVIFMRSDSKSEAYQIFQVLNDRGVHLTDGDLLRSSTMEKLDDNALRTIQDDLSKYWDSVLAYPAKDVDSYLRWYFSSYEGKRPKPSNLASQFLEHRFGCVDEATLTKAKAKVVLGEVKQLDADFSRLQTLGDGEWPYGGQSVVTRWDRERLRLLVTHLDHKNALPLLLSLCQMKEKDFAAAVAVIERAVFRYKTIGNMHVGTLTKLYIEHAKKIRDTNKYSVTQLRKDLRKLVLDKVPDSVFKPKLMQLMYSSRGGNKYIKYMLITLEDYYRWYEKGASGSPKCQDKGRVFDFPNTTFEHVYPRSAKAENKDSQLEMVKDTIGNLTILGPEDNDKLANQSFDEKSKLFEKSSLTSNRKISEQQVWTSDIVEQRTENLADMALKVFCSIVGNNGQFQGMSSANYFRILLTEPTASGPGASSTSGSASTTPKGHARRSVGKPRPRPTTATGRSIQGDFG